MQPTQRSLSTKAGLQFATAIDTRLYLPKEWTDDAERCNKAGIPESERVFKTKIRPKANWLWKSLSRPVAMECVLVGLGPMRATAVVRTFYLLWPMRATPS